MDWVKIGSVGPGNMALMEMMRQHLAEHHQPHYHWSYHVEADWRETSPNESQPSPENYPSGSQTAEEPLAVCDYLPGAMLPDDDPPTGPSGTMEPERCECIIFKDGVQRINSALTLAAAHGIMYTIEPFQFCPWCGKPLAEKGEVT